MNLRTFPLIAGVLLALCSLASQAQASFTLVRAQTEVAEDDHSHEALIMKSVGSAFAEIGGAGLYAKGRASFGNAGAYAVSNADGTEAFGETWWADGFTVTGGTGAGSLTISISVSGTLSGAGNAMYGLYARGDAFGHDELLKWLDCAPGRFDCHPYPPPGSTALIPMTEAFPASGMTVLTTTLPFTYGETVYLASYFGVETWKTGEASFYGSAHFGVTAPESALLATASGTTYGSAAAVPEPSAALLWLLGGVVLWVRQPRLQRLGMDQ
jgi:hypothetical protein